MKRLLFVCFLFPAISSFSQSIIFFNSPTVKDTIKLTPDTLYYSLSYYLQDEPGVLYKKTYYKGLREGVTFKKQNIIETKVTSFIGLDSVREFIYDEQWELIGERLLSGKEVDSASSFSKLEYAKADIVFGETVKLIEGKKGKKKTLKLLLSNDLPQNNYFQLLSKDSHLIVPDGRIFMEHRSELLVELEVSFESGFWEYELEMLAANGKSQKMNIEVIGYDLSKDDFVGVEELSSREEVVLSNGVDIFIETPNNEKLLKVRGNEKEENIPLTQVVNKLSKKRALQDGNYIFELVDLAKGSKSFCKVKLVWPN
ncbi:hypothetical protein R9C00_20385 [Flammeovirgaceae bacterium SG7u.111]|nr:hypothetical protein [Flammeovirgaceae bacterium SG7u.132]WPO34061.1 hypothetical protein R9C00_20385 [Flammeovirgaceae bacterium SG7u.111]